MDNNIYFYIPGIVGLFEVNFALGQRLYQHPEHFYDNVKIGAIFGTIPGAIWNGGRVEPGHISDESLQLLLDFHNDTQIPFRWTWTNPTLTSQELRDPYCNRITKMFENGINEILVSDDRVERYLRKEYPLYPIISSTTKRITKPSALSQELNKNYKLVVLDYDLNNNWDILNNIQHPEKCEILIQPLCNPKCPVRLKHYEIAGYIQKGDYTHRDLRVETCTAQHRMMHEILQLPTVVTKEDLYNQYVPKGFRHFKIEGRGVCPMQVIEWYLYYMVKPEFHNEERAWLQQAFEAHILSPNIKVLYD
jgi:collagenase-like PrtC family protease